MPSTYTVNLGIEKPATGEQSGTWGDTTNVNFDILDQAINGAERVTLSSAGSSGSPNALIITNGAASDGRNKWIEFYSSGDLGGDVFVQLQPNDAEKIVFVRNSLAGSRSVLLFQGTYNSGRDLEIPAGVDMVVKFDGGGASAANVTDVYNNLKVTGLVAGTADINGGTVDGTVIGGASAAALTATTVVANTSVNIAGDGATVTGIKDEDDMASNSATKLATQQSIKAYVDSQVGTVDTLAEILANGNTTGSTDIDVDAAQKVQFRDSAIYINSSVDGQLDIVADTEIQIAATTIDINGAIVASGDISAVSLDISGDVDIDGTLNVDAIDIDGAVQLDNTLTVGVDDTGYDVKFYGATGGAYMLWDESADDLILAGAGGLVVAGNVDFNGDLDVDGVTNLDVVDIDGAVDMASTLTVGGDATFNTQIGVNTAPNANWNASWGAVQLSPQGAVYGQPANSVGMIENSYFSDDWRAIATAAGTLYQQGSGEHNFYTMASATADALAPPLVRFSISNGGGITTTPAAGGHAVFNEGGIDADFRVESDGSTHMLFVEAETNRVGINNSDPSSTLHVTGTYGDAGFIRLSGGAQETYWYLADAVNNVFNIGSSSLGAAYDFRTNDASRFKIGVSASTFSTNITLNQLTTFPTTGFISHTNGFLYAEGGTNGIILRSASGGAQMMKIQPSEVAVNDDGENIDFRVESDTNANMLVVDASTNRVHIGTTSGTGGNLIVASNSSANGIQILARAADDYGFLNWNNAAGSTQYGAIAGITTGLLHYDNDGYERMRVTSAGVIVNESGNDVDFRVESGSNANMLFVDANNNRVGIGTGAPSYELVVSKDGSSGIEFGPEGINSTTSFIQFYNRSTAAYDTARFYASGYDYYVSATVRALTVGGTGVIANEDSSASVDFRIESNNKSHMLFVDSSLDFVGFETSTRINSSATTGFLAGAGQICIETQVSGGDGYYGMWFHNNAGTQTGYIYNNGSSTSYNTSSDERLKENILDSEDAGALIDNIQVRSFDWKETGEHQRYGMVAQELQTVAPEAVHEPEDADAMMAVDYAVLVPMLIKEIQSLRARVADLES